MRIPREGFAIERPGFRHPPEALQDPSLAAKQLRRVGRQGQRAGPRHKGVVRPAGGEQALGEGRPRRDIVRRALELLFSPPDSLCEAPCTQQIFLGIQLRRGDRSVSGPVLPGPQS